MCRPDDYPPYDTESLEDTIDGELLRLDAEAFTVTLAEIPLVRRDPLVDSDHARRIQPIEPHRQAPKEPRQGEHP